MDPIGAGLMLCVAGYIAYRAFRPRDKATAMLRSIARLHGGRLDKHGTLQLIVDGFAIEVRALLPSDVNNKLRGETYWRIKLPPPGTTTFAIYPEGFKSHASKALGTR
ncbi:MAG TPA: hypothetical protein VFV99_17590, partial [Kofleriaceae bacterium]|nr:hypothetical protein [Kofleriaceae bacterium]